MDDVILNKSAIIERCITRVREEYTHHEGELETHFTRQDSIILNLQRACEAAIDLGTRLVAIHKLGVPQSSRDVFALLEKNGSITPSLSGSLQKMVGFRNVAVRTYDRLDLVIVRAIITERVDDLLTFAQHARKIMSEPSI